jgi:hypothetical protein
MWFFNINDVNSNNMFIVIIKLKNILKINMLKFDLWLLYIIFDKDHEMYTWSCFHLGRIFNFLTLCIFQTWFTITFSYICFLE